MDELLWIAVIGFGSQVTAQLVAAFFAYAAARKIEENTKLTAETHAIVNIQRETMVARIVARSGVLFKVKRPDLPLDWKITPAKLRPIAFCRTKAGLLRVIAEKGFKLTATGTEIVERLKKRHLLGREGRQNRKRPTMAGGSTNNERMRP